METLKTMEGLASVFEVRLKNKREGGDSVCSTHLGFREKGTRTLCFHLNRCGLSSCT